MQRFLLLPCLLVLFCFSVPAKPKSINVQTKFDGLVHIEGDLTTDPSVDIVATGSGDAVNLFQITTTELRWTVRREVALGLLAGTLREAPVNSGSFFAQTATGNLFEGKFTAVVTREGPFHFGVDGSFVVTGGTGDFQGFSGDGTFRGTLDIRNQAFDSVLHGELIPPSLN